MMKNVKILISGLSLKFGGIERYILNTAGCLSADGFIIDCIIHDEHLPYLPRLESMVRRFIYVPPRRNSVLTYNRALENALKQDQYDIVWMHVSSLSDLALLQIATKHQVKVRIVHSHTTEDSGSWITKVLHRLNKANLRQASALWACSRQSWNYMFAGMPDEKKYIAPNAIDPEDYAFRSQDRENWRLENGLDKDLFLFGSVSRLSAVKNLSFLIPLFARLQAEGTREFRYVIVGEGPEEAELRRLVEKYSLGRYVVFHGHSNDVARVYSALDCLLMPSLYEGIPFTLLEAQMSGLPVICSDRIDKDAVFTSRIFLTALESACWMETMLHLLDTVTGRTGADVGEVETSRNNIQVQSENLKRQLSELLS
ncbi:MAG: glycosyltransferase [Bacillota bacterium]|nr:glycosyltransferase [Bacillota bacterium]